MKPSLVMRKCCTCFQRIINPCFSLVDIFYAVFLLKFMLIYSRRISRIPEPWLGKLMSCGKTVMWPPSMRYLMHWRTRRIKMFLLFSPVLLHVLIPMLLPVLSL